MHIKYFVLYEFLCALHLKDKNAVNDYVASFKKWNTQQPGLRKANITTIKQAITYGNLIDTFH